MKYKTNIMLILLIFLSLVVAVPYAIKYDREMVLARARIDNDEEVNHNIKKEDTPVWYDSSKIIIVGDSRMYAASRVVKDENIIFIAKNAVTCNYIDETAEKEIDKLIEKNPDEHYTIFFNLGVNDLDYKEEGRTVDGKKICNASDYIDIYTRLRKKWKNHNLVFESVNPLDIDILKKGKFGNRPMTNNDKIAEFNSTIFNALEKDNFYYCDTYTYLLENGFESTDGLHYSDDTSKVIIEQLKKCHYEYQNKANTI